MEASNLTELIIKAAYEVHSDLGTGFIEKVYENALIIALHDLGLKTDQQTPLNVTFWGKLVGEYFADIIVNDSVIIELKTVQSLLPEHQAQVINYLSATRLETALLINFAKKGLEFKRLYFKAQ